MKLQPTSDIVKQILIDQPVTRNSDMLLYVTVCEQINPTAINGPFWHVLLNLKQFGLPNIETVRRTRQKVQQCNPELAGNSTVEGFRTMNENEFRAYARKGIV